ncbi:MAG: hypothetical protein GY774_24855 [Planctomycetes bacterium]|nr:hypothetical protein [Planctomycetota bacterium]
MKKKIAFIIQMVILSLSMAITSDGAEQERSPKQMVKHSYLCSDIGAKHVFKISETGKIEWEYPADQCTDAWLLDNGNILMSFTGETRGVREVTPDKKIIWEYTTDGEVWGCQRLPNGNTLVAECTAKRLIEVNRKGQIVKVVPVESGGNTHMGMRHARKLPNGNYLVALLDDKAVWEYDSSGKMIREITVPDVAFSVIRLDNGNTVIGYRGGVIEVDPKDKVVWHLTQKDVPDVKLYWICCIQRLPNGNTVVGNWFIHKRRTDSTPFFEVTPDKKVVWRVTMHKRMFDPAAIQILGVKGYPLR